MDRERAWFLTTLLRRSWPRLRLGSSGSRGSAHVASLPRASLVLVPLGIRDQSEHCIGVHLVRGLSIATEQTGVGSQLATLV